MKQLISVILTYFISFFGIQTFGQYQNEFSSFIKDTIKYSDVKTDFGTELYYSDDQLMKIKRPYVGAWGQEEIEIRIKNKNEIIVLLDVNLYHPESDGYEHVILKASCVFRNGKLISGFDYQTKKAPNKELESRIIEKVRHEFGKYLVGIDF